MIKSILIFIWDGIPWIKNQAALLQVLQTQNLLAFLTCAQSS